MRDAPWNTLTGRMILVTTAALVLALAIAVTLAQYRFELIFVESLRTIQAVYAADAVKRLRAASATGEEPTTLDLGAPIVGTWPTPGPEASHFAVRDADLEARVASKAGLAPDVPLRVWTLSVNSWIQPQLPDGFAYEFTGAFALLHVALQMEDGVWLNFLVQPRPRIWPPSRPLILFSFISVTTLATASALAARRIAAPFRALTAASQRLAMGNRHEPIPVFGPKDVRRAQTAFNIMGARLQAKVMSQKALLVAIGHDLRTPLTGLRVRAELLADENEKRRITRMLGELERLTEAALQAASHAAVDEPAQPIDVAGLVNSVCDDLVDLGWPVIFQDCEEAPIVESWPDELARALRNVIENAVRYGEQAHVRIETTQTRCAIIVTDQGPGVPEADQERVFDPLVRLESSRSKSTGGHGLGLHIARNTLLAHRGDIHLRNRDEGGLEVTIDLPVRT